LVAACHLEQNPEYRGLIANKARVGAIHSISPQITLPVYTGKQYNLHEPKREGKLDEPEGEGVSGGVALGDGGIGGEEDSGGGDSFKFLTQTRLSRISMVLEYMKEHRVINGLADVGSVGAM
jgi:hypothetical protein